MLDFLRQGISDSKIIASEGKMPPFTASNLLKQSETLHRNEGNITTFFKKLVELDYDIKTGAVPAEYFWLAVKEMVLKKDA